MKRISLFIIALALVSTLAMAVPARRGVRTHVQSDGSTISYTLHGDEHFHVALTTDGHAIRRVDGGDFRYVTPQGVSNVVAHDPAQRTAAELEYISVNSDRLSYGALTKSAIERVDARKAPSRAAAQKASQVPNNGSPRVPILLVSYSDVDFIDGTSALQTFNNFFKTGTKSAYQYFADQSNGQYTPQFDVYGPIKLSNTRAYYGGNDSYGDDLRIGQMVAHAVTGLNSQIDYSKYDNDGDGECDVLIVLYAGEGEASSYADDAEDYIWPCQWDLYSSDYNKDITADGVTISKFAVFNELNGASSTPRVDGVGTFCHEFSHCLGLPDFYNTGSGGPYFGMSEWSLMDYGCYNDDGYTPIGYSAYEKNFMGWLTIPEAEENTYYTMPVLNNLTSPNDQAVKLTNTRDANEYYIIENRARQGWDRYIAADGLLITHVIYSASAWSGNTVNNYALQRMTPIPADNNLKLTSKGYSDVSSLPGDLWPYGSANQLTDTSTPAAKVNTGSYMGKPITEMTRNADGTISFWAMKAPLPTLSTPVFTAEPEFVDKDRLVLAWTHEHEGHATYTVELRLHPEYTFTEVFNADFTKSLPSGWKGIGGYNQYDSAEKAYRLGSGSNTGILVSPEFTADDSEFVTVTVHGATYGSDTSVPFKVSTATSTNTVVYSETLTLSGEFTEDVLLLANAGETTKIRLETTTKKKRINIYDVIVWNGDATQRTSVRHRAAETGGSTSRVISGIEELRYEIQNLEEYGTFDFRVKAVPKDPSAYDESDWSDWAQITLSAGIDGIEADPTDYPVEYYNLQGIKVDAPNVVPGVYIRRQGPKAVKVAISR